MSVPLGVTRHDAKRVIMRRNKSKKEGEQFSCPRLIAAANKPTEERQRAARGEGGRGTGGTGGSAALFPNCIKRAHKGARHVRRRRTFR